MTPEIVKQWSTAAEGTLAAVKSWSELSVRALERISAQQIELAQINLDTTVRASQLLSESKNYKDLAAGQAALAQEYNERVATTLKRNQPDIRVA